MLKERRSCGERRWRFNATLTLYVSSDDMRWCRATSGEEELKKPSALLLSSSVYSREFLQPPHAGVSASAHNMGPDRMWRRVQGKQERMGGERGREG